VCVDRRVCHAPAHSFVQPTPSMYGILLISLALLQVYLHPLVCWQSSNGLILGW
jgi:hypothetical protein